MSNQEKNSLKRKHENDDLLADENEKNLELEQSYVTMIDVLKEEEKLEEDANAVLGGSDDKNCTFDQGYIARQALYSCRTCMGDKADEENVFGVCLACSFACHADHDLFELYTKRAFRCDCGTSKMKGRSCSIDPKSDDALNEKNKYNHNFVGKYCLCDLPYPSVDGKDEEMVQCIVCEDWFHENCLGCSFPCDEDYAELICKNCMQKNAFLWHYQTEKLQNDNTDSKVTESKIDNVKCESVRIDETQTKEVKKDRTEEVERIDQIKSNNEDVQAECSSDDKSKEKVNVEVKTNGHTPEAKTETVQDAEPKDKIQDYECKLKSLKLKVNVEGKKNETTFWDEGWRSQLCRCDECLSLYTKNNVKFLVDETDTVHHYEARGKEKCREKLSQYEQGMNEISKMDHVVGIDAIMEYNNMSTEFKEHFKKFAEAKKVIEQKDIVEFFETLKFKKRMKMYPPF